MQERDEELAWAYDTIDGLEKTVLRKDNTILKMGIALSVMLVLLCIAIWAIIFLLKFKPMSNANEYISKIIAASRSGGTPIHPDDPPLTREEVDALLE
jgi:hypothetical protein